MTTDPAREAAEKRLRDKFNREYRKASPFKLDPAVIAARIAAAEHDRPAGVQVGSGVSGIDEAGESIGQGSEPATPSADATPPAQAAEPPSDLPPYPTASQMRAREEQVKQAVREAKREAVGILRLAATRWGTEERYIECWCKWNPLAKPEAHTPVCQKVTQYIAAFEAEQEAKRGESA